MAQFLTDLCATLLRDDSGGWERATWRLDAPLEYSSDIMGVGKIVVPKGFETDFASVPRLPMMWVLAGGVGHRSATIHDWLYSLAKQAQNSGATYKVFSRAICDAVFAEALACGGVGFFRRGAMWAAVRLGGWRYWGERKVKTLKGTV